MKKEINIKAILLKQDGTKIEIEPINGKNFTLEECYRLIETDIIQVVKTIDNRIMIIDEEGKLKGHESNKNPNEKATKLYIYGLQDIIVGDVIVCDKKMFK